MAARLQSSRTSADSRIDVVPFTAIFLLTLVSLPANEAPVGKPAVARPATSRRLDVRLLDLAAIRRLINALVRQGSAATEGERAAAWATSRWSRRQSLASLRSVPSISASSLVRRRAEAGLTCSQQPASR